MRSGLTILRLCIGVLLPLCVSCSVESTTSSKSEPEKTDAQMIVGEWACASRQISGGQTITVTSQAAYSGDGTLATRGTMVTDFQGMQITVKLGSQSRWTLAGETLTIKTELMDIDDIKASGGYADLLSLEDLERGLRQEMRASVARGEAETFTIETLTPSQLAFSGISTNFTSECTR